MHSREIHQPDIIRTNIYSDEAKTQKGSWLKQYCHHTVSLKSARELLNQDYRTSLDFEVMRLLPSNSICLLLYFLRKCHKIDL